MEVFEFYSFSRNFEHYIQQPRVERSRQRDSMPSGASGGDIERQRASDKARTSTEGEGRSSESEQASTEGAQREEKDLRGPGSGFDHGPGCLALRSRAQYGGPGVLAYFSRPTSLQAY